MEPISEERQRKVYEWLYPDLKGKKWENLIDVAEWHESGYRRQRYITPLYLVEPNYQFFFTEIVPRLQAENKSVFYSSECTPIDHDSEWRWGIENPDDAATLWWHTDDPIAATAEYVEAMESK